MDKTLQKLRDSLIARAFYGEHGCFTGDCPHDHVDGCHKAIAEYFFDAALTALSEQAGEFDWNAAKQMANDRFTGKDNGEYRLTFVKGMYQQFEADRARIELAEQVARYASGDGWNELPIAREKIKDLTTRLSLAEQDRDSWMRAHKTASEAGAKAIEELTARLETLTEQNECIPTLRETIAKERERVEKAERERDNYKFMYEGLCK